MNTDELFKCGVTLKEGVHVGKRFKVEAILRDGIHIQEWDKPNSIVFFCRHGDYDIWRKPKTLFEDGSMLATWGNLKRAVEEAGLGDDTRIKIPAGFWIDYGCQDANAKVVKVDGKEAIYFY